MGEKRGFEYLIAAFNTVDSQQLGIAQQCIVDHIGEGFQLHPEKLPELLAAYEAVLDRVRPDIPVGLRGQRTLANIAAYAFAADHPYAEALARAMTGGPSTIQEYLRNPAEYGPALKALSQYLGVAGPALEQMVMETPGRG